MTCRKFAAGVCVIGMFATGCAAITRSSDTSDNTNANDHSSQPSLSGDAHFIAYTSTASNLVGGDVNATGDVFIRDQQTKAVTLVSASLNGRPAGAPSDHPSASADGRYVAFRSWAANLVTGDSNQAPDIFVRDTQTATTIRASVANDGSQANNTSDTPSISTNGRYVAFASIASNLAAGDSNGDWDVFVRDLQANTTRLVSVARASGVTGNGQSAWPAISADGRYVAFRSTASNLVTGDTNTKADIFVRDMTTNTTTRVSVTNTGAESNGTSNTPAINGDGRYVAFDSTASNLVTGDTNGKGDVFVRDRTANTTTRVSIAGTATQADGRSDSPALSADGRFVAFESRATNLVAGDSNAAADVFVRDRTTNATRRVSTTALQDQANGPSGGVPSVSGDGRYVAFQSGATNLSGGDSNARDDVYTRYVTVPKIATVSPSGAARGATVTITITGKGFLAGANVLVTGNGLTAGPISPQGETKLTFTLTVAANAPTGSRDVWVYLPGGGLGPAGGSADRCSGCLTIS